MKKILFAIFTAVCAASCLGDGPTYSGSYTVVATFEYGNICGTDSLYFENQLGYGITWQDLAFNHKLSEDKSEFLGGFMISCLDGKGRSDNDIFRVNSGKGYQKSSSYAVFHSDPDASKMPEYPIEFVSREYGVCKIVGCYVNNTAAVVDSVRASFVPGDRLSLKMTGYKDGKKTGSNEIVLAEYTDQKDSVITEWTPFMLAQLGHADFIKVEINSTKDNIPAYVCIDDMMADVAVEY